MRGFSIRRRILEWTTSLLNMTPFSTQDSYRCAGGTRAQELRRDHCAAHLNLAARNALDLGVALDVDVDASVDLAAGSATNRWTGRHLCDQRTF